MCTLTHSWILNADRSIGNIDFEIVAEGYIVVVVKLDFEFFPRDARIFPPKGEFAFYRRGVCVCWCSENFRLEIRGKKKTIRIAVNKLCK